MSKKPDKKYRDQPIENLTVRDYFAAQAMQTMLGNFCRDGLLVGESTISAITRVADIVADSMLERRG